MPKADGTNHSRDGALLARSRERAKSGEWPLRKRGYYRALARNEGWAIELSKKPPLQWILCWVYRRPMLRDLVYSTNTFLSLVPKDLGFSGQYIPVPIFGKKRRA